MIFNFHKIISLNNLKGPKITKEKGTKIGSYAFEVCGRMYKKGQIATLFILMIIFVLIFTLVVINIGNISGRLTQISNAIDSGGLYLGSQLATKGQILYEALGNKTKRCVRGGLLAIILAIIVAVVLTYLCPALAWYWVALAAAIAGMIGGLIVHGTAKGAVMGAIQGAMIGAAVAGGAHMGGKLFAKEAAAEGAMCSVPQEAITAGELSAMEVPSILAPGMVTIPSTTGAIVGVSLAAGANIYTGAMSDKSMEAGMEHFAKALGGLPDYESVREGVFLYVFSGTVDDPNKVQDTNDIDCDGKIDDEIPQFSVWWDEHIKDLKASLGSGVDVIADFLNNSLKPFKDTTEEFVSGVDRGGVECDCSDREGPAMELWQALETCDYEISFWEPGPGKLSLVEWYKKDCEDCPPPSGYDDVDGARYHMEEFIDYAEGILEQDAGDLDKNYDWIDLLYNTKDSDGSGFYDDLALIASVIPEWIKEIEDRRDELPGCQLEYLKPGLHHSPIIERKEHVPFCNEYLPPDSLIYPCNWIGYETEKPSVVPPNPVCKIYDEDELILRNEIKTVREFVLVELREIIREKYIPENPCQDAGEDCTLVGSRDDIEIIYTKLCLDGKIHAPCDHTDLEQEEAIVSFRFYYRCICSCCYEVCPPDEECYTVCEEVPYVSPEIEGSEEVEPASDLQIPCFFEEGCEEEFLKGLEAMEETLDQIKRTGGHPPKDHDPKYFATIDQLWDDEFTEVLNLLRAEQESIVGFLPKVEKFHDDIQNVIDTSDRATDGAGSITYEWDDRRGGTPEHHSVTVETGPFKFARLKKKKHGNFLINKVCIELKDYNDDGSRTWIKVTRDDPDSTNKDVGILGKWNPGISGEFFKECRVYYSYDKVGIKSVK